VKWRIALPEAGNSTPIVWGDRSHCDGVASFSHGLSTEQTRIYCRWVLLKLLRESFLVKSVFFRD